MKKKVIFKGCATALVTPFSDGEIDYEALGRLIEFQILSGIPALVIGGTTGEAATLSDGERYRLFRYAKEKINGRAKLIFGTGTNDTKKAIKHTELAERIGCDGALVVTPYYNKGTKDGITEHYKEIAKCTDLPIILYNVPSRTGVDLSLSQLEILAKCDNVVAIKEASDSLDKLVAISSFGEDLALYAGCDSHIHSVLSLGGLGVVSVVSNAYPKLIKNLTESFFKGETELSLEIQKKLSGFISAAFCETNPAPIKYALSEMGFCKNELRLPLLRVRKESEALIKAEMKESFS